MKISALLSLVPLVAALPGSRVGTTKAKDVNAPFGVTAARSGSPIHFLPPDCLRQPLLPRRQELHLLPQRGRPRLRRPHQRHHHLRPVRSYIQDVVVPGGQSIYVAPSGALSFTTPHSGYIPAGSSQGPFVYTPGASGNPLGTWTYTGQGASGFMACPVPASNTGSAAARRAAAAAPPTWQVYAAQQNATVPTGNVTDCLGFDALAVGMNVTSNSLAWEYI
ncbi:hypothetical protein N7504_010433 [Penicillium tannophilum]|nr:hypothetical protein N7504_010433 [Penicillium tannophilum]